jgi:T5SS/PEP-CTERM-associated repeat protein
MFTSRFPLLVPIILAGSIASASAATYVSAQSGDWSAATPETWTPNGNPLTGSTDSVSILTGHTVIFAGTSNVGLINSNDLGAAGGQTISIDGGVLSQTPPNFWIRIGHESAGTLNINDGRFHFTNSTATASPNLQIGVRGGEGFVNVGDGIGAAGSAVLNLRDIVDGTANVATVSMNLGAAETNFTPGLAGTLIVESDGLVEGDNGVIRIGQAPTPTQAQSLVVVDGGQFRAHGTVELGSQPSTGVGDRSNGALRILNGGTFSQDVGELVVGWNGDGTMVLTNGTYQKTNNPAARGDIYVGREAAGVGTVTVNAGGQFLRETGPNVGDMRIGFNGTGTMTVNEGGLVQNNSNNWDWVGQNTGSNGTLTINSGGIYRHLSTSSANLSIGVNAGATGIVTVNGGTLELLSGSNSEIRLAQNGTGTFRQISGITDVRRVQMAENDGTAVFDLQGGIFTSRSQFFLGGSTNASVGTGTATMTMSGGELNVQGAFVVGLATGHTASLTQTGGTINHTLSDITVGESGTGTMRVGAQGTLNDTSSGNFFVGRNAGSNGTLYVDGTLSRTAGTPLQVGNVDPTGVGVLGGTGTINVPTAGVIVGAAGTLTPGTLDTVGSLSLTGNLTFLSNGLFFINFDSSGGVDRVSLTGNLDLGFSRLDGNWTAGGPTGPNSRYWIVVNDDIDPIFGEFTNLSLTNPSSSLFPNANGFATIDGQEFAVYYSADFASGAVTGGNDLMLAAVPEPGSAMLLAGAIGLVLTRRMRRAR